MNTKLVIAAVTTVALTNLAHADKPGKPTWDPKVLEELLKNEKLVKNYGTVGYPLADELDPGWECKQGANLYNFGLPLYQQDIVGIPFTAGIGGELNLIADSTKIGAELKLGPTVELFNETLYPIDVTFSATTAADGTNSIDYAVNLFGQQIIMPNFYTSPTPISKFEQFGYSTPQSLQQHIGDSYTYCYDGVCGTLFWDAHADLVAHIGGYFSLDAAFSGIEAHALFSAASWADVGVTGGVIINKKTYMLEPFSTRLDVIRLVFGGRAQLLPQSGGGWVAGAATSLTVSDTMGVLATVDLPILKAVTLFKLDPLEYDKQSEFSCSFSNKMDPKNPKK